MRFVLLAGALATLAQAAPVVNSTLSGTDLTNATVVSVPYNGTNTNTSTQITGNNPKDGTNSSLSAPYTPAGGDQQRTPTYRVESNFDFQSLNLALNQELIELDLFHNGLARFSVAAFEAAGLTADDRFLIEFMADQEVGHALALTNIIGPDRAAKQCVYQYPYNTVQEFILFCQLLTRFGESGVYGFLPHLDSRPSAQILLQSITTEARQQMIFRQFQGLFPMPVWFETGIPQSYAWTLLSPYIKSCPSNNPHIEWQNFPALHITNQPYALGGVPAVSTNRSLTAAGRTINFAWEAPGKVTGYDGKYNTSTVAGEPKFAAFISQLNVTYVPLFNVTNYTASVYQPGGVVYPGDPQVNGTMFVSLVDEDLFVTPYNLTLINNHTVAGPALYQSG
ncbi:hypothetical protein RQP46_009084 [Phenoliferia psychrophenolica]